MTKRITAFDDHYDLQEIWIRGQIDHFKHDSFVDLYIAHKEIEEAGITAFPLLKKRLNLEKSIYRNQEKPNYLLH